MNQPVDLNKLKGILNKSKAVMKTVESGHYKTGNIDGNALVQETIETLPAGATPRAISNTSAPVITEDKINNSRLPDAIKKVMLENPIPQMTGPNHTFTLDDVSDLVEKPIPAPKARQTQVQNQRQYVQEQLQQPTNMSEDRMRAIVQEEMAKFFSGYFMKQITETIQKQTIKNLLDTGIIKKKVSK